MNLFHVFPSPNVCPGAVRELSALHTKRLMVTFDESEAERERDVEDATREVGSRISTTIPQHLVHHRPSVLFFETPNRQLTPMTARTSTYAEFILLELRN